MMNQEVRSIMTKDPIVANINQTIDEVGDIMM